MNKKLKPYRSKILGLCMIILILPSKSEPEVLDENNSEQVKVRAVFIDCEIHDNQMPLGTDTLRFQREELFKHSALRNCKKKLAVTVKMFSDSHSLGDEYIPIEHVFDVSNKKRVRLLNPYILRLRREPPFESYKLHVVDSFNGLLTTTNDNMQHQLHGKETKIKRNTNNVQFKDDEAEHTVMENIYMQLQTCPNVINMNTSKQNWQREKRFDIERRQRLFEKSPNWLNENLENQLLFDKMEAGPEHSTNVSLNIGEKVTTISEQPINNNILNDQVVINNNNGKNIVRKPKGTYDKEGNIANDNRELRYVFGNKASVESAQSARKNFSKYTQSEKIYHLDGAEKEFVLYEIGSPDIWFQAQVQLLEKLSTPEGKTFWRDITQQESARVSSSCPEWRNEDLHIQYRCADWVPREDFTISSIGLGLLVPRDGRISNGLNNEKLGEFLIVPYEDIETDREENLAKRRESSSTNFSSTAGGSVVHNRRVVVRTSRALFGKIENQYMIIDVGPDKYLRLPYRQSLHAQIDLEAKADENQLVYVGSSGRLTTAVSESTRRARTALTVQVTNTGLVSARFRPKIRDCVPEVIKKDDDDDNGVSVVPILIPPMHSRTFRIEIPEVEGATDVARCSVVLLNDADESVAIREVRFKRGDRCFCVWHCQCVCLNEDPTLLCQEMAEYQQIMAGLSPRERPRQVRAACYPDVVAVNLLVVAAGVIFVLLALGFIKACLGLFLRCVGSFGIEYIIQAPRRLNHYYELELRTRTVVFDKDGWPVHPDTKKRTVRLVSKQMEFMLNIIFFITLPCLWLWQSLKKIILYCQNNVNEKGLKQNAKSRKFCSHDINMQERQARRRYRNPRKRPGKWMTRPAEELSEDIWEAGLTPNGFSRIDCVRSISFITVMRPLLRDERYYDNPHELHSSIVDSEHEDTEYVLLQMQKSKESLAVCNFK